MVLLHREAAYEKDSPRAGEADLIVAKHRNGPTDTITVAFQGHYSAGSRLDCRENQGARERPLSADPRDRSRDDVCWEKARDAETKTGIPRRVVRPFFGLIETPRVSLRYVYCVASADGL